MGGAKTVVVAALAALVIQGTAAAACWQPDEIVAHQVKDFQYMLMVGALECRGAGDDGRVAYNDFVTRQRDTLDAKAAMLKAHFDRENGAEGGRAAYDTYSTALSNHHAARADERGFCAAVAGYTRMAATLPDRDFVALAQAVSEVPASRCGSGVAVAAMLPPAALLPRAGPAVTSIPAPAVVRSGHPDVDAAVAADAFYGPDPYAAPSVPAVAAAVEPVRPPAVAVAPAPAPVALPPHLTLIADAPVVPPEPVPAAKPTPTPTEALQAAIVALQAATAALKAQMGPTS